DPLDVPEIDVLEGGTVTLLVEYYRGEERLYGNGALVAEGSSDITASPEQTFLFENREWLQLTPGHAGDHTVNMQAGASSLGTLTVHAVRTDSISSVEQIHDQ